MNGLLWCVVLVCVGLPLALLGLLLVRRRISSRS